MGNVLQGDVRARRGAPNDVLMRHLSLHGPREPPRDDRRHRRAEPSHHEGVGATPRAPYEGRGELEHQHRVQLSLLVLHPTVPLAGGPGAVESRHARDSSKRSCVVFPDGGRSRSRAASPSCIQPLMRSCPASASARASHFRSSRTSSASREKLGSVRRCGERGGTRSVVSCSLHLEYVPRTSKPSSKKAQWMVELIESARGAGSHAPHLNVTNRWPRATFFRGYTP